MVITDLIEHLKVYVSLENHEIEALERLTEHQVFPKNEIIFQAGKVSDTIYFVLRGCVRLFYDVDGDDKTAFFYTEGKFICAGESYTYLTPARENYQALEDTEIILFNRENTNKLLEISSKFELLARIATEDELITSQRIIASFVMQSAEERYLDLLKTNRQLFQRVPQQYIASFLGVSPETLSRIKRRVASKKL